LETANLNGYTNVNVYLFSLIANLKQCEVSFIHLELKFYFLE